MTPVRPPSFPPATPRRRPAEVSAEVAELHRRSGATRPAEPEEHPAREAPVEKTGAGLGSAAPARAHPRSTVSTRLAERLEELRTAKHRARRTRVTVIVGAIALAAVLAWIVAASPLLALNLDEVELTGASAVYAEPEAREALAGHAGTPLARLDLESVRAALRESTAVKEAVATRRWPTGLHVEVQLRTPVAATPSEGGYTILDGEGVVLADAADAPEGLPIVDVPPDTEDMAATIEALLHVMDTLPQEILEDVSTVGARSPEEVTFTLESGGTVVWGGAQDSALKASVLQVLLEVPAKTYNVTSPLSPITS